MLAHPEFGSFDGHGPQRLPSPATEFTTSHVVDGAAVISQIYAAAWTTARRDHELDKLFNAEFYERP